VILDGTSLAGSYELFRKHLYDLLEEKYPGQLHVERFNNLSEEKCNSEYQEWLGCIEDDDTSLKKRESTFEGGVGKTMKDKSILTLRPDKEFFLPQDLYEEDFLENPPRVVIKEASFHEYGVGMLLCDLFLDVDDRITLHSKFDPKTLLINCSTAIMKHESIENWLKQLDIEFEYAVASVKEKLDLKKPVFSYEDIYFNDTPSVILWTQTMFQFDELDEDKKEWVLNHGIEVSHPDGPIDYFKGREGFVHVGWQTSMVMRLTPSEEKFMYEGLRHAEIEWRTLSILGELLTSKMTNYVNIDNLTTQKIQEKLGWINDLRLELDLYTANQQNIVQNMNPAAYFVYKHTREAWRIEQMEAFFSDKLDAFDTLYQTGRIEIEEKNNKIVNNILFVFTLVSIVSTIIDSVYFVDPDITSLTTAPFRMFMLLSTPLTIVTIVILYLRVRSEQLRKKR
jgi:hypothetical protein